MRGEATTSTAATGGPVNFGSPENGTVITFCVPIPSVMLGGAPSSGPQSRPTGMDSVSASSSESIDAA